VCLSSGLEPSLLEGSEAEASNRLAERLVGLLGHGGRPRLMRQIGIVSDHAPPVEPSVAPTLRESRRVSLRPVVWSTSPRGGASAWKSELLETDGSLSSVACPSRRACLIADTAGRLTLGVTRGR
jgi:hypothetical protein